MQSNSAKLPRFGRRACVCQSLGAAGLSAMYVSLYCLASFCLATGAFHPDDPLERPHHSHHHQHQHDPSTQPGAAVPDVCDFALQIVSTPLWYFAPALPVMAFWRQTQVLADASGLPLYLTIVNTIRAPPERLPEVA